jgi:hypothetical protein
VSFGRRLALFFLLIAIVPTVALIAILLFVSEDSQRGKADARLAAGILYVPEEITFATDSDPDDPDANIDEGDLRDMVEEFLHHLAEHLRAPVEDRSSAAALVPLLMRGPAELYDKIGLIEVARGLDISAGRVALHVAGV